MRDFLLRLLTHEVQIALSSECVSNETNHFMKLYPTINNWRQRHEHTHVCVHLCIHQAKGQCLITNQRLEQFKKMLKKTLGCNRSASKLLLFFFKAGGLYHRGRTSKIAEEPRIWLSVHDTVPVPEENILPLPMIIRSWWPYILITASVHCVMYNTDLVCWQKLKDVNWGSKLNHELSWCQPQMSVFPLPSSPWLLGLLDWWDWVYLNMDQPLSNPWSNISPDGIKLHNHF